MAVLYSKDNKDLFIDCNCTCGEGVRIRVVEKDDYFFLMSYVNNSFSIEQEQSCWKVFCKKIKKIWYIIRGKDYLYSEICMTKDEFEEFKNYITSST